MKTQTEVRILKDTLRQLDDPDESLRKQHKFNRWVYGASSIGLMVALVMAFSESTPAWLNVMVGCAAGITAGAAILHRQILKQWPVTMSHVDRQSVEARLAELSGRENP